MRWGLRPNKLKFNLLNIIKNWAYTNIIVSYPVFICSIIYFQTISIIVENKIGYKNDKRIKKQNYSMSGIIARENCKLCSEIFTDFGKQTISTIRFANALGQDKVSDFYLLQKKLSL